MSCNKCEIGTDITYIRVGNGNVELRGCVEHLRGLIDGYKAGVAPRPANLIEFGDMVRGYYRAAIETEDEIERCKGIALMAAALMHGLGEEL